MLARLIGLVPERPATQAESEAQLALIACRTRVREKKGTSFRKRERATRRRGGAGESGGGRGGKKLEGAEEGEEGVEMSPAKFFLPQMIPFATGTPDEERRLDLQKQQQQTRG